MFIKWDQPYFKQIDKACMQLKEWNVMVLDDNILIHVAHQMYDSDWFSEETMMNLKEILDNDKT